MVPFSYVRARDIAHAAHELGAHPATRIIAGGTNLLDLMKYDVERPARLVDITRISGLDRIEQGEHGLYLGAMSRNSDVARDPAVLSGYPLLASAILHGASGQLRNAATTGGNLMQRTRCYYFYDTATACNKRAPGSGCAAAGGVNRVHAILGASPECLATNPSDMNVALAALEAVVVVEGAAGGRRIPIAEFHRLPGSEPERDNTLRPGEIILGVELPAPAFTEHWTYLKLRDRQSYAFALVSVAVGLRLQDGVVAQARLALGGVAHKPWRVPEAEAMLEGLRPAEGSDQQSLLDDVAQRLLQGAQAAAGNGFKIALARRAIPRAIRQALAGTPQPVTAKHIL